MVTLRQRYGGDDRILIQALYAATALLLAAALAGWARAALYVLGAFGSLVAGLLAVVVGRRLRRPAA